MDICKMIDEVLSAGAEPDHVTIDKVLAALALPVEWTDDDMERIELFLEQLFCETCGAFNYECDLHEHRCKTCGGMYACCCVALVSETGECGLCWQERTNAEQAARRKTAIIQYLSLARASRL